jgi:hypothetical protein
MNRPLSRAVIFAGARYVWLRKGYLTDKQRVNCTVVKVTDLGQVKIIAHYPGYDVIRYVERRNLEKAK